MFRGEKILLASSALKESGFDGLLTIKEADEYRYPGCQLYLDSRYHEDSYRRQIINELRRVRQERPGFTIIFHLPNTDQLTEADRIVVSELADSIPDSRFLIHYSDPIVSRIGRVEIDQENALTGSFDVLYMNKMWNKILALDLRMVLDFGRFWYGLEDVDLIIAFTKRQIDRLDPAKGDILHLTDKNTMADFRENACVVGKGLCALVMDEIIRFARMGGIIVLEYEDIEMERESRRYLLNLL